MFKGLTFIRRRTLPKYRNPLASRETYTERIARKKISGLGRDTHREEMMLETPDKLELLSMIDILVDGRYDKSKRNLMLQFRGSSNQRNYRCTKIPQKWASGDLGQA